MSLPGAFDAPGSLKAAPSVTLATLRRNGLLRRWSLPSRRSFSFKAGAHSLLSTLYHSWLAIVSSLNATTFRCPSFGRADPLPLPVELPIFLVLYLGWRLIKRSRTRSLLAIDLDTGRFVNSAVEEADDAEVQRRESGKYGWAWKMYSWVA